MTLYNSTRVLESVKRKHPKKRDRKIIAALDDFASNTTKGHRSTEQLLLCGGQPESQETFEQNAIDYLKPRMASIAPLIWIAWSLFGRQLVMSIIASFIESLLLSHGGRGD